MLFFSRMRRWRVTRKKKVDERALVRARVRYLKVTVVLAFCVLAAQLWRMQIVEGAQYQERAEANRLRLVRLAPPRGVIYDRTGKLLVRNEPSFTAAVVVADLPTDQQSTVVSKLALQLKLPVEELDAVIDERRASGEIFTPVALKTALGRETAFVLEERAAELPGVHVLTEPRRRYGEDNLLSHILGYVGRISPEEHERLQHLGYDLNAMTGKMGVENTYEWALRGVPGLEQQEVDASGRTRRILAAQPPLPGNNLILSINADLQRQMTQVLQEHMGKSRFAAAVAMNPKNGEILGMVSVPTFDHNAFAGGIKQDTLTKLLEDPRRPLLNYAVGGAFPPGSTFKVITGAAALQEGIARPSTLITSTGSVSVPNQYDPRILYYFYDWAALGTLNFYGGLSMSSDVYFYYLGGGYRDFKGLGPTRLSNYARMFGLGEATGVDVPGEARGSVPDPQWKEDTFGEEWLVGDTYNYSIGQGFLVTTPLQMTRVLAAVLNGGDVLQPHLVKEVQDPAGNAVTRYDKTVVRRLGIDQTHLNAVRKGMEDSVRTGAARSAQRPGVDIAGKTGTAEFGEAIGNRVYETHGWFMGYTPSTDPDIAVTVFFEHGAGGATAAPAAGKILEYYAKTIKPNQR